MQEKYLHIGLDIGSVSVNTVLMKPDGEILEEHYTRIKGRPVVRTREVLLDVLSRCPSDHPIAVSTTGIVGRLIAELLGGNCTNEVVAQAKATEKFHPEVRTLIEIGGEDAKLIFIVPDGEDGGTRIADFAMNSMCAAGTGSFLDQQASRLNLTIEEFGELALKSANPPRIAGRCSVFAKSDMIHHQQIATADYDIVGGLCFAVARNFRSCIGRGRELASPVSFQGGVAANPGVRRAFREVLGLEDGELIIPERFASMGAIGAVLTTIEQGGERPFKGLADLEEYLEEPKQRPDALKPLTDVAQRCRSAVAIDWTPPALTEVVDGYLGLDVGSISTNVVVIDGNKNVLARRYLMTAGRPIEAVRQGLAEIAEEVGDRVRICGVATTGSGRYLTGGFVGADVIRNEITAQATAAMDIDPEVDTVFEIGGQDSKYISISDGAVVDFEMNKVCAAGTGSFLEEQAEKLGISIKDEFGELALSSSAPVPLGERCTVFMESDLVRQQQLGARVDELVSGLSYSIVHNYLNRVVGDRRIGKRVFIQGGTASNPAVVAAFEKVLGQEVTVPAHHDVTGAIGAAILAMKTDNDQLTRFKGFDITKRKYELSTFECQDCPNHCEIRKVTIEGDNPLFYGSRCEKYEIEEADKKHASIPDLFAWREKVLLRDHRPGHGTRGKIGIPQVLFFHELLPMWITFFQELGYEVELSSSTNKKLIHNGVEKVVSETCFPVKVAHGHILDLVQKGAKRIFLPHVVNLWRTGIEDPSAETFNCPYVQTLPYTVRAAFDFDALGVEVISPVIHLGKEKKPMRKSLKELASQLGLPYRKVWSAFERGLEAQRDFRSELLKKGDEVIASLKQGQRAMVLTTRPYNGCDMGINLAIPQKMRNLGVLPIPLDMLPVEHLELPIEFRKMYWKAGQRFLQAALYVKKDPRLFAVHITNFGCGPDSFISHFFRDLMSGKPYLQLEVDEHSADAGAITRLEAFLDSLENYRAPETPPARQPRLGPDQSSALGRKLLFPYMCHQANCLVAAFQAYGVDAELIPESDDETLEWGKKYTTGKECYPCVLTTGDIAKMVHRPDFDPDRTAFFMPSGSGPCRFGCYHRFHRYVLDEMGFKNVPILSPHQDTRFYEDLGITGHGFDRLAWKAIVAGCYLERALLQTRPYETNQGETDDVYWDCMRELCAHVKERKPLIPALEQARERFRAIPVDKSERRPVMGVVGEIYVRLNRYANENMIRQIEELGGEVRLSPFTEWIYYLNVVAKRHSRADRERKRLLTTVIKDIVQHLDDRRALRAIAGLFDHPPEPTVESTLAAADPYLSTYYEGEAVLSIGRSIEFVHEGVNGIVNLMPFTCMPGTIVHAILKRCREAHDNIPVLNLSFEGHEQTTTRTRLEAFMHQARHYQGSN
jgi:predicted CoA-substrate-specific enzyme activase